MAGSERFYSGTIARPRTVSERRNPKWLLFI